MENKDTKYLEDNKPDDFIKFLFNKQPQEKNEKLQELSSMNNYFVFKRD